MWLRHGKSWSASKPLWPHQIAQIKNTAAPWPVISRKKIGEEEGKDSIRYYITKWVYKFNGLALSIYPFDSDIGSKVVILS